jgi:hypothetical protein
MAATHFVCTDRLIVLDWFNIKTLVEAFDYSFTYLRISVILSVLD